MNLMQGRTLQGREFAARLLQRDSSMLVDAGADRVACFGQSASHTFLGDRLECLQGVVFQIYFVVCSGVVLQVLFQAKQLTLVTSGDDADVRVWDLVSKSCVAVLKVRPRPFPPPRQQPRPPAPIPCAPI